MGSHWKISEAEAANLETSIDQLLKALRQLDEGHEQRWPEVERLKAETHVMMEQIRTTLNVERLHKSWRACLLSPRKSTGTTKR